MDGAPAVLLLGRLFHNRLGQIMEHTNKAANDEDVVVYEDRKEGEDTSYFLLCGFCWSMCAWVYLSGDGRKYGDGAG